MEAIKVTKASQFSKATEPVRVCRLEQLEPFVGRAAWVEGEQIALFNIPELGVFAVQNWDPIGKAYVLCRGIVGDIDSQLCVASPLYKQHFNLETGTCIERPEVRLRVWAVNVDDGYVVISA
jgi:nitrite reductase (NADH) small subunit